MTPNRLVGANEPAEMPPLIAIAIRTGSTRACRTVDMPIGAVASPACGDPIADITVATPKKATGTIADRPPLRGSIVPSDQVDGAVQRRDAEEEGDAGDEDQDVDRESGDDLALRHAGDRRPHQAGRDEHQQADVHPAQRRDGEDRHKGRQRRGGG